MSELPTPRLTVGDVVSALEELYPSHLVEPWDRVGLVTGDLGAPVDRIHLAVDPTLAVIADAVSAGAQLLLTHHPLLLRGVSSVPTSTAKGAAVTALIKGEVALYVAHTNADKATPGVCDALAAACGLLEVTPIEPSASPRGEVGPDADGAAASAAYGVGRVGHLPAPTSLADFVDTLAAALPATIGGVRVAGPREATVQRVAVVGGSGDDLFDQVRAVGADVYVTADLRHHPVLEARETDRGGPPYLVDAGHWASESLWLASAAGDLAGMLSARHPAAATVEITVSSRRTEPWDFVVGANRAQPVI